MPQRDVLHIRLHSVRHRFPVPLVGESPVASVYGDIGVTSAIATQQLKFYLNEARPSAVLSTDLQLDKDQVQALRDRWDEQTKGRTGGRRHADPHLGLKGASWVSNNAKDSGYLPTCSS